MYKSGQTPDDVYYSPGQAKEGYVQAKNNQDNNQPYNGEQASDDYLRMKVQDPARWSTLDYDMYGNYYPPYSPMNPFYNPFNPYGFSPYGGLGMSFGWGSYMGFGGGLYYGSYFNPFGFYGGYYPYYPYYAPPVVIVKGGSGNVNPYVNGPRTFTMSGYGNSAYVRGNGVVSTKMNIPASAGTSPVRVFGNVNNSTTGYSGSSSGSYLRGGSSGSNPFGHSSSGSSTRTFEPRSSNSSSSGSSLGGSTRSSGGGGGSSPSFTTSKCA